jgi:ssDNA-binding Zn-finger/Zn-ribbon topoisomerase 1
MSKIKPCPFCGCTASLEFEHFKWWVQCDDLDECAVTDGCLYDSPQEAEERWNRRPTTNLKENENEQTD